MRNRLTGLLAAAAFSACLAGCDVFTDGATRLAYALEAGTKHLGAEAGATYTLSASPAQGNDCTGPYTVQFDKVGALIIWCKDGAGKTIASHSTSYHAQFVDTPRTWNLDKPAGSALSISLQRQGQHAVITDIR